MKRYAGVRPDLIPKGRMIQRRCCDLRRMRAAPGVEPGFLTLYPDLVADRANGA
jgi:hypothetical protein